tara:strand:- start:2949 stop:3848 length:900 start_codon:yes stop_codon:yes gene_type:complete
MNDINNIKLKHLIFTIVVSILLILYSLVGSLLISYEAQIFILFFFVVMFGIPHGFYDYSIAKKLYKEKSPNWFSKFTSIYIITILISLAFWNIFPLVSLIIFLGISLYHFGYEEVIYNNLKSSFLKVFIIGSVPVVFPFLFYTDEVLKLFSILIGTNLPSIEINNKISLLLLCFYILYFYLIYRGFYLIQVIGYLLVLVSLPPLISFVFYFCFVHSARHVIDSYYSQDNIFKKYHLLTLTLAMALISLIISFVFGAYLLEAFDMSIEVLTIKYIFIGLFCLTVPHILLSLISLNQSKIT